MRTIKEMGDYEMVSLLVVLQHSFLKSTHKFAVQAVCISGSLSRSDLHNQGLVNQEALAPWSTCWQCSRPVPKIAADERIALVLAKSRLGLVSPQVPTALLFRWSDV